MENIIPLFKVDDESIKKSDAEKIKAYDQLMAEVEDFLNAPDRSEPLPNP